HRRITGRLCYRLLRDIDGVRELTSAGALERIETHIQCGCGGTGRRAWFRSMWGQLRGGSSPLIRTKLPVYIAGLPSSRYRTGVERRQRVVQAPVLRPGFLAAAGDIQNQLK